MCYVVVTDANKQGCVAQGCVAFKTRFGKELSELTKELNRIAPRRGIQIVTISRPTAYGEYAPYSFVQSEEELKEAVRTM